MGIKIDEFCKNLDLEVLYSGDNDKVAISNSNVNRPGLQLHGFFKHFDFDRLQIIGKAEDSYLRSIGEEERRKRVLDFFSYPWPCLVVCWGIEVGYMMEACKKYNKVLLRSQQETTKLMIKAIHYLDECLAPTISIHGVLVEVYGIGILITGSSGIGKSETALELLKRGHRLISDDVVEIKRTGETRLIGTAPDILKQYMEIRGIGIIDVKSLYGVGAVKENVDIDMCIHLEPWQSDGIYNRLGLESEYLNILGVDIEKVTIPVTSGRNLAIIIETAARNNRQKVMGINSAAEFIEKVNRIAQNKAED